LSAVDIRSSAEYGHNPQIIIIIITITSSRHLFISILNLKFTWYRARKRLFRNSSFIPFSLITSSLSLTCRKSHPKIQ
jgi:hypothetical protein